MKLYCFYRYDKSMTKKEYDRMIASGATQHDIRMLYAITPKKKWAHEFMSQRDMNQFILITTDVDKEEASEFLNRHNGQVLDKNIYIHYPNIKDQEDMAIDVKILSTYLERNTIDIYTSEYLANETLIQVNANPYTLKDKYYRALDILDYQVFFKLINSRISCYGDGSEYDFYTDGDETISFPNILIDEMMLFIRTFGYMFK